VSEVTPHDIQATNKHACFRYKPVHCTRNSGCFLISQYPLKMTLRKFETRRDVGK